MCYALVTMAYDHNLPFDVDALMPKFPYRAQPGWMQIAFAVLVGLTLGGAIGVLFAFFTL